IAVVVHVIERQERPSRFSATCALVTAIRSEHAIFQCLFACFVSGEYRCFVRWICGVPLTALSILLCVVTGAVAVVSLATAAFSFDVPGLPALTAPRSDVLAVWIEVRTDLYFTALVTTFGRIQRHAKHNNGLAASCLRLYAVRLP